MARGHVAVVDLTGCALPYAFLAWAEQHDSSGAASIDNATTPLMTALMVTVAFRVEPLSRNQIAGQVACLGAARRGAVASHSPACAGSSPRVASRG